MNAVAIWLSASLRSATCSTDVVTAEATEAEALFLHDFGSFFYRKCLELSAIFEMMRTLAIADSSTGSSVSSRMYFRLWLRIRCGCFGHGELHGWEILNQCWNVSAPLIPL